MSLVLLKPDAIRRGLIGPLLTEYGHQFSIARCEMRKPTEEFWKRHYREHVGKIFWPGLLYHMMSDRVLALLVYRDTVGDRGDTVGVREYTMDLRKRYGADRNGAANLLHASTLEDVIYEIDLWFPGQLQ